MLWMQASVPLLTLLSKELDAVAQDFSILQDSFFLVQK